MFLLIVLYRISIHCYYNYLDSEFQVYLTIDHIRSCKIIFLCSCNDCIFSNKRLTLKKVRADVKTILTTSLTKGKQNNHHVRRLINSLSIILQIRFID